MASFWRSVQSIKLLITNTFFRLPTRNKTSWMHPRSKHWHFIDYVIVRRKDRQDVRVTKTMCGADCWTDHRLVVRETQPAHSAKARKCQRDWMSLSWNDSKRHAFINDICNRLDAMKQDSKRHAFINDICSRLDAMKLTSDYPEENWTVFRDTVHSSAMDSLGPVSRKQQDWFEENDEEIQGLLEEKHQKHKAYFSDTSSVSNKAAHSNICKTVQTRLRYARLQAEQ